MILIMTYQNTNNNVLQLPLRNCKLGIACDYFFNTDLNHTISKILLQHRVLAVNGRVTTPFHLKLNYGGIQNG